MLSGQFEKYFDLMLTHIGGDQEVPVSIVTLAQDPEGARKVFDKIPREFWDSLELPLLSCVGASLGGDFSPDIMEVETNIGNVKPENTTRKAVLITTHPNKNTPCPRSHNGYSAIYGTSGGATEFIAAFRAGNAGIEPICDTCKAPLTVVGAFTMLEV